MDFLLILGPVVFEEFEIPDSIKAGGRQALGVHKYAGGFRTVDTTGPDDDPITWSGYFEDDLAQIRCQQLDTLRRQGAQIALTWSSYSYLVVIDDFKWDFRRFYHIPYSISLTVIQDNSQPGIGGSGAVESLMQGDIGDALADASGFALGITSGLAAAVQGVADTVATVQSISNASTPFLAGLTAQVAAASALAHGVVSQTDAAMSEIGNAANFAGGTDPDVMVANVNNLVIQAGAMSLAFDAANKLDRLGKNISAVAA